MNQLSFQKPPTLENDRIKLIPMEVEHSLSLFVINHPAIWTFMLIDVKAQQDMDEWVTNAVKLRNQGTALPFVVLLKETNQVVGTTRLYEINKNQKSCELGSTWYGVNAQRTFVNSDCKFLLLKYCFEELELIRVQIKTDERNERSQKAIERLGATKEGVLRNERILSSGYIRNAVLYSITNSDWGAIKRTFINRNTHYSSKQKTGSPLSFTNSLRCKKMNNYIC
ncbi:GNAT family N-acetyltransferase [Sporosarcina limicola]|uniref:RimJ/RimL family protein N-acetyltransferase n=1 Tax=Sporosarcina limicola TaxID=34101 RepID=A0A927RDD7_9BACL|nr:GNAT family protein [Sporosarcina limicola]MBE1555240.1 RimJ/RimL family protein N-acetyltransferase [Sporosarcina limicola]